MAPSRPGRRKWQVLRALWLAFALLCLLVPAAHLAYSPLRTVLPGEQRKPAMKVDTPPRWSNTKAFRKSLDRFLRDQFVLRPALIGLRNRTILALGMSPTRRVIIGRDGWLFAGFDNIPSDLRGLGELSTKRARAAVDRWTRLARQIEARGIPVVFVVAPNKSTIYRHHLPRWLDPVPFARTDLGRFRTALAGSPYLAERFVDLRRQLLPVAGTTPLYKRTDTHWNVLGAFIAYRAIAERVSRRLPHFAPMPQSAFDFRAGEAAGDLARMMNPNAGKLILPNVRSAPRRPVPRFSQRRIKDPGSPFPTNILERVSRRSQTGKRVVLIVGDSFANYFAPFFVLHADKIVRVHHRAGGWPRSIIDKVEPTVVVIQVVERYLRHFAPR